jgi:hypothetical protein
MKQTIEGKITAQQYKMLLKEVVKQMELDLEMGDGIRVYNLLKDVSVDDLQSYLPKNIFCHDMDGNILNVGDSVVVVDVEDLDEKPTRGQVLVVSALEDAESNYVRFNFDMAFFGSRVLKLKTY